ncbi:BlaI/MecI/CopY family transcriptional regulator [Sphingomonas nostoxanthinifaciens]|uniref:BlaI/MecI/CopY family transcriptional regulator n=1 Tax=Sphingomonas nostoxanthinifaciens TaxID=2872652 RepID=UPI001CC1E8E1|nr:BlaI/MecI/CopY family transcriptional regulator [Sphingomonas nostoxanthinifaciens]UAK23350.1 BlaI/MecI/CopY family transcriptional regulator [Sphingomonas nostoxanthinifaciens]
MAERISDGEHVVMEVLWADAPLTAADVAGRIDPARGWSDRTVKTMLGRLLAKGALSHEEDGRRYLYRPAVARADYVESESRRLVDRLFGGRAAPLVAHLAERQALSEKDISELEALLRELRQ